MTRHDITEAEAHERALGRLILWGCIAFLTIAAGVYADLTGIFTQ